MERKRSKKELILLWAAMAALLSQNLVVPALSEVNFEDQKNFFYPDPNAGTPPTVTYNPPAGGDPPPPPFHGGGSYGGTPPAGGNFPPTPSHGGGSYGGTPPAGGHSPPTPSHGGDSYGVPPPSHCGDPSSGGQHRHTPSPPSRDAGGYYHTPPTSTPTPIPIIETPPTTVMPPPTIPGITTPSPPLPFDPNSPPFTCTYWRNHPTLIWGLLGWWGTVGNAFGVSSLPGIAPHMSLLQALSNNRADGYGELYREGTASLLNSMAHTKFPYTTTHVRDSFVTALGSKTAAAAQAHLFKLANEGRIKGRA